MNERPATIAACVNGLIVVVAPPVLLAVLGASNDTAVHPAGYSYSLAALAGLTPMAISLSPLALLAGWRTFVYAKRRCAGNGTGWRGVLEAGGAGFLTALLLLARGTAANPRAAPPYILAYGGAALVLGLVFGLILRTTAVAVLNVCGDRA